MRFGQQLMPLLLTLLGLISACGSRDADAPSAVKITNGIPVGDAFPAVVQLRLHLPDGDASCTATFVNDAQVVTAAHCVYPLDRAGWGSGNISFARRGLGGSMQSVFASRYVYFDKYTEVAGVLSNEDLAVVTFPRGSAPGVIPIYKNMPRIGQQFVIVGFGANDYALDGSNRFGGGGPKRAGTNVIKSFNGNFMLFDGIPVAHTNIAPLGRFVASGAGDSGGPLLIGGALAGVTSGGGLHTVPGRDGKPWQVLQSAYLSVNAPENSAFLRTQLTFGWH